MWRLTERIVRSTLVTACRLATSPTSTSPLLENATTDGVVRPPSAFAMMLGSPPSRTETAELVVPRSIPTARAMRNSLGAWCCWSGEQVLAQSAPTRASLSKPDSQILRSPDSTLGSARLFPPFGRRTACLASVDGGGPHAAPHDPGRPRRDRR